MIEMVPKPRIRKRKCGGYLATSPKRARFIIGVTGNSKADVESKFWYTYVQWCETNPCSKPRSLAQQPTDGEVKT